jgi:hypothetical protein
MVEVDRGRKLFHKLIMSKSFAVKIFGLLLTFRLLASRKQAKFTFVLIVEGPIIACEKDDQLPNSHIIVLSHDMSCR